MNENILSTIKKLIGIEENYNAYDADILIAINSAVATLSQIGIGPEDGLIVTCENLWYDIVGTSTNLEQVKQYVYLCVKKVFDPPQSSAVLQSYENLIKELEWRLNTIGELERGRVEKDVK